MSQITDSQSLPCCNATKFGRRALRLIVLSVGAMGIGALPTIAAPLGTEATPIAYDGFAGGPRADLAGASGGIGWSETWSDQSFDLITSVVPTGLQYPNLAKSPGCALTPAFDGDFAGSQYQRSYQISISETKLFVSFLLRTDAGAGLWGGLSFNAYPYRMTAGVPLGLHNYGLLVNPSAFALSQVPVVQGETVLLVVKISKNSSGIGANYELFVNPTVGNPEPATPSASYTLTSGPGLPSAVTIDNTGGFATDEIRVGLTWESVLPAAPPCPADFNGDGVVGGADIGALLGNWGQPGGDLNGDGTTNGADIGVLLGAWGACG